MPSFPGASGGAGLAHAFRFTELRGLTHDNIIPKNDFWFPIAPGEFAEAGSYEWATTRIVSLGEVSHRAGTNANAYEIETFFPGWYSPRLCRALRRAEDFMEPERACAILRKLKDKGAIFGFILGSGEEINEKVFITEFSWSMKAGTPLDRTVSLRLQSWEPQEVKSRGGIKLPPLPSAYKLRPGEDLQDASLRIYGHVKNWKSLRDANQGKNLGPVGGALGLPLSLDPGESPAEGVTDKTIKVPKSVLRFF